MRSFHSFVNNSVRFDFNRALICDVLICAGLSNRKSNLTIFKMA